MGEEDGLLLVIGVMLVIFCAFIMFVLYTTRIQEPEYHLCEDTKDFVVQKINDLQCVMRVDLEDQRIVMKQLTCEESREDALVVCALLGNGR